MISAICTSVRIVGAGDRRIKTGLRELVRCGWAASLVGDDIQNIAFQREASDGFDEILTVRAVHPRGAKDDMARIRQANPLLASKFATSVCV